MKYFISYIICLLLFSRAAFSQDWPLKRKVQEKKDKQIPFVAVSPFSFVTDKTLGKRGVYQELKADSIVLNNLLVQRPEAIQLTVPLNDRETITCELIKADLGNVQFTKNRAQSVYDISIPLSYRGIVTSKQQKNNVIFTLNNSFLSFTATDNEKVIQFTQIPGDEKSTCRLYNSTKVEFPAEPLDCGTLTEPSAQAQTAMLAPPRPTGINAPQDKCVYVFVECFDSLYQWRNGSYQQTIDYVYALYNNIATGYLNEQINIKISTINVWTTTDPYRGDSRENAVADLAAYYQDNFWGNICVGLDYSINQSPGRSGLAGAIGKVKGEAPFNCPAYSVASNPFCYNDLDYNVNVQNFPTGANVTQQQVYLVMHEMGHLLGSAHTQWCGWLISTNPNVYGALDNCAAVEGTCSPGPAPPVTGGTIMSYCVGAGQFVNFNNGFGTLPGNAVRSFVDGSACLLNCPACPATLTLGALGNGPNHFEASNTIFANGLLPASSISVFDAGSRVTLSPGFRVNNGAILKIINNGCGGIR